MARRRNIGPHTMLGAGGVIVEPQSESAVLDKVITTLRKAHSQQTNPRVASAIHGAMAELRVLREQVGAGYHRNPSSSRLYEPFKVIGTLGRKVESVEYIHEDDGKPYRHDFKGTSAEVLAVERHGKRELLITSPRGVPLWDEF